MPTDANRAAEVLALIEHYSDIAINANPKQWDMFARVLHEIGSAGLENEDQHGEPDNDTVIALQVISAAFERVQQADMEA